MKISMLKNMYGSQNPKMYETMTQKMENKETEADAKACSLFRKYMADIVVIAGS